MNFSKLSMLVIGSNIFTIVTAVILLMSFHSVYGQMADNGKNEQSNTINLIINNLTVGYSPTGLVSINGVVFNNSTQNIENIKVDVTLYDAKNNTIMHTSRFVSSAFYIFEPNSTENFDFLMSTENFNHYDVRAYAEKIR